MGVPVRIAIRIETGLSGFCVMIMISNGLERLIEESKQSTDESEAEFSIEGSPDDLEESLKLLIERDNPMADVAEKTLDRL